MLAGMDPLRRSDDVPLLAERIGVELIRRGHVLATAESCTGGGVAHACTAVAGSSTWFDRGFVTYSNEAKCDMLAVSADVLAHHGAVSEEAARAMAQGALKHSRAQVAIAVTGIAGPGGGTPTKPVGMVWFAWVETGRPPVTRQVDFSGDREAIRRQAVVAALDGLRNFLMAGPR